MSASGVLAGPLRRQSRGLCEQRADHTPREFRGPILRPFLDPRYSRSERLKQFCMFRVPSHSVVNTGLSRVNSQGLRGLRKPAQFQIRTPQAIVH
eukprot:5607836-Alexandrium_andersonii.AAC.1